MARAAMSFLVLAVLGLPLPAAQPHPLMSEYNHAWQLSGQLRLGEAIPLLKQVIAKDKTFYRAYNALAEAYHRNEELEKAERYFRSLLAQDPQNGQAHYALGEIYEWKERWDLAAEHYTDCIQKSPRTFPCYSRMVGALSVHRKHTITVQDPLPRPLHNLKSPFRQLLLAAMYSRASAAVAITEAQAALGLALSRNDSELVAQLELLLAQSSNWAMIMGRRCNTVRTPSKSIGNSETS
jgi:tetratricopeptide (TPR) repeat protein